ncbi:MAG: hypothetical protein P8Y54_08720 [Xanthomonadales bacterium]
MPKRLLMLLYFFGLVLITLLIVVLKPAQSESWSGVHEFPVAQCDDYEIWTRADSKWRRQEFFSRDDNTLRVTNRLEDWDAVYYNSERPEVLIRHRATGIGDNLELTLWSVDGQVVRIEEKGNPFRVAIPDIGSLVLNVSRNEGSEWNRFDAVPEGDTESALCEALAG